MIGSKYPCSTCTNTFCWLCKGNVYYDRVMSLNTYDAKEHKQDIGLFRDFVKQYGCASNSSFIEERKKILELLRSLEWAGNLTDYEDSWSVITIACPCCRNAKRDGHKPICKLAEMIKVLQ